MKFRSLWGFGRAKQASFEDEGPAASIDERNRPTSDEELLRRFTIERDERAFESMTARYGDMVWGVCRRVLGSEHDAEDAFQAVFLVLARKADTLRRGGSLPAWLHQTAFRTALRCRARRARRRTEPLDDPHMIPAPTLDDIASEYDQSIVDAELNGLPERYRLPLFLCCVEGKSLEVAARQLGWSLGSVKGRLERGRQALRRRLLQRKVPLGLGFALLAATASTAQAATPTAAVPASLIYATTQAGMQVVAGRSPLGYVSHTAVHLAQGSSKVMTLLAAPLAALSLSVVGVFTLGGGDAPASQGSGNSSVVTLQASFTPSAADLSNASDDFVGQLALADREGDKPREGGDAAPREGAPREGTPNKGDRSEAERLRKERLEAQLRANGATPRDGDRGPEKAGPRDGEKPRTGPRDGEQPRTGPRDGEKPRTGGEGGAAAAKNPLGEFQPQTPREKVLYDMILNMQREMAQLRQMVQQQNGVNRGAAPVREGAGTREGGAREGGERRDGAPAKEGGAREGGEKSAPRREGEK